MICIGEYVILLTEYKGGGTMEFLYRLYSYNYFGIGLFIVITVLAFSFLVILFFGKKDEKAREIENAKKTESENLVKSSVEDNENTQEELKVETIDTMPSQIEEPAFEMANEEINISENRNEIENMETEEAIDPFIAQPDSLDEFNVTEEISNSAPMDVAEPKEISYDTDVFNFEFDANSVNDEFSTKEYAEENPIENNLDLEQFNVPIEESVPERLEEPSYMTPEVPSIETEEFVEQRKAPMPTVFSSVYLNNEKATEVPQEEPKVEMTRSEKVNEIPTPTKPTFEMPKKIELPKRNNTIENTNENIINSMNSSNNLNTILNNAEEDSYTIK